MVDPVSFANASISGDLYTSYQTIQANNEIQAHQHSACFSKLQSQKHARINVIRDTCLTIV